MKVEIPALLKAPTGHRHLADSQNGSRVLDERTSGGYAWREQSISRTLMALRALFPPKSSASQDRKYGRRERDSPSCDRRVLRKGFAAASIRGISRDELDLYTVRTGGRWRLVRRESVGRSQIFLNGMLRGSAGEAPPANAVRKFARQPK